MPEGQLEALTGIHERRWWEPGFPVSQGATLAARKALETVQRPAARPGSADLRGRVPGAVRAGHGLPGGGGARRPARRGFRPEQRLPGRPQRHRRDRQPHRAGPGAGRHGRFLRDGPRDQRRHDRGHAADAQHGDVQDLGGHADGRVGGGGRGGDGRLVRQEPAAAAAGRHDAGGAAVLRPVPLGHRHHAQRRPAIHVHRLGVRAQVRRRAGPAHLGRLPAPRSAGPAKWWTRSSATRSAPATAT